MKVNFKAMPVEVKFGEPEVMDVRHTVGNTINRSTSEIGLADLARQIYYDDDPVEIPEVYRPVIIAIITDADNILGAGKKAIIGALTPAPAENSEELETVNTTER